MNGICDGGAAAGPGNAARVAVESRDFVRAVQVLEPHKDELDSQGLVTLALALGDGPSGGCDCTTREECRHRHRPLGGPGGALEASVAGERRRADATRAMELYKRAYELSVQKSDHERVLSQHQYRVHGTCEQVRRSGCRLSRGRQCVSTLRSGPKWILADGNTSGANVILGNTETANTLYREAVAMKPEPAMATIDAYEALRIADLMNEEDVEGY